jgi:hypothetical protein
MERLMYPFYPSKKDNDPVRTLFPKTINTGFIYTMNAPEERMKNVIGYDRQISVTEGFLKSIFGRSESLVCCDTYQYDDYSKIDQNKHDPEKPDARNSSRKIAKKPLRWGKDSPRSSDGVNLTTGYRGVEMSPRLHLRWQLLPYFKRQQASV